MPINIEITKDDDTYIIKLTGDNYYTGRQNTHVIKYNITMRTTVKYIPSIEQLTTICRLVVNEYKHEDLFGKKKFNKRQFSKKITDELRKASKRNNPVLAFLQKDYNNKQLETTNKNQELINQKSMESVFKQDPLSATTNIILGSSFSGKTHFLVQNLNKLLLLDKQYRPDFIILMTESPNAPPLKQLNNKLNVIKIDRYCPKISLFFLNLNKVTNNKYRILLILDDVIDVKNKSFNKMFLTLRNNGISSCALIQHVKMVSPAVRSSVHNIYIIKLKVEDWEYVLKYMGLLSHMKEILDAPHNTTINKLCYMVKDYMTKDDRILWFDNRKDKVKFISRT